MQHSNRKHNNPLAKMIVKRTINITRFILQLDKLSIAQSKIPTVIKIM